MKIREITEKIRRGEIDCNNQSRFLSILSKGLLAELRDNVERVRLIHKLRKR